MMMGLLKLLHLLMPTKSVELINCVVSKKQCSLTYNAVGYKAIYQQMTNVQ